MITAVAGPELAKTLAAHSGDDDAEAKAARDLADAESRRDETAAMFAAAEITRREWLTIRQVTDQRIADATRLLNRRRGPLADLPADETALRQGWDAATVDWRRALIGAVVESLTVRPVDRPTNTFDPARVDITWAA